MQELRGNIRVHCRLRPLLKFDLINVPERLAQVAFILDKECVYVLVQNSQLYLLMTKRQLCFIMADPAMQELWLRRGFLSLTGEEFTSVISYAKCYNV